METERGVTRRRLLKGIGLAAWGLGGGLSLTGGAGASRAGDSDPVVLSVDGAVADDAPRTFTLATLEALGLDLVATTTPWHAGVVRFQGPRLAAVLDAVGARGDRIEAWALNDYHAVIPQADARNHRLLLATRIDGAPIPVRKHGPLFLIYPFDDEPALRNDVYFARSVWQVKRLHVV